MPKIVCGPFAGVQNDDGIFVTIPVQTQADWVNTPQGHQEMENVCNTCRQLAIEGHIPRESIFEFITDDTAVLRVPCKDWPAARVKGEELKKSFPGMIGAAINEHLNVRIQ